MNKHIFTAIFLVGAAAIVWIAVGFVGVNPLAVTMTALIAIVYCAGARELMHFRNATAGLTNALAAVPDSLSDSLPNLDEWLARLHPSLQNAVRQRIEGERGSLPGPALTPYLVGLLVMLGMLGTFLGMVVTFKGAAFSMEGSTDLQTLRSSLSTPIKGLGLAFGTSVAGVAASAMLGLLSALSRRERLQAAQLLDAKIAGSALRGFSLAHQRQQTFAAIQQQAEALPQIVTQLGAQLQALMSAMEQQNRQLSERLLDNQQGFHNDIKRVYGELAGNFDHSLKSSLAESVRATGDAIRPVVASTLNGIAAEATQLQQRMVEHTTVHIDSLSARIDDTAGKVTAALASTLAGHEHGNAQLNERMAQSLQHFAQTFEQRATALLASLREQLAAMQTEQTSADQQRLTLWSQSLDTMSATLQREWQQAGAQTLAQQQEICRTLDSTARDIHAQAQANAGNTLAEITRLLDTAAEAPRVAAEVIGKLREELSGSMARDNAMLEERSRIMSTLSTLLEAINHASTEQRAGIDALTASAERMFERVGTQVTDKVEAETARLSTSAAQITGSAVEVSSLSEAFGVAVQLFSESNDKLVAHLQRIEAALDKSMARSDDQLAYYVAQAREIIDLSIASQQAVIDDLRQLGEQPAPANEAR